MSMTINEMIEVLQAYKEGKPIEFKRPLWSEWNIKCNSIFNFNEYLYRVKKEKKEVWLNIYPSNIPLINATSHPSEEEANKRAGKNRVACVRVEWEE